MNFAKTPEAAFRRLVREVIRDSHMSKGEQAVTTALVNLWFHHRNGPKGHIHPGRERLAKTAKVSVRTVASTLAMLRAAGVLVVIGRPRGEGQRPTQYRVRIVNLFVFCGADLPAWMDGPEGEQTGKIAHQIAHQTAHQWCAEIAHSLYDVRPASAKGAVNALRVVGGGRNV